MKREHLELAQVPLREVAQGEYFTLTMPERETEPLERRVWVRGEYDRASKKYSCYKWADVNHETFMKGTRKVWVGFCF